MKRAKVTPEQVQVIRALAKAGHHQRQIGNHFGLKQCSVSYIVSRRAWPHVPDAPVTLPDIGPKPNRQHVQAKLTPTQVQEVRNLLRRGYTQRSIAKLYGVTQNIIYHIGKRNTYTNVPDAPDTLTTVSPLLEKPRGRTMTAEEVAKAKAMRQDNQPYHAIAKAIGVSIWQVYYRLHRNRQEVGAAA